MHLFKRIDFNPLIIGVAAESVKELYSFFALLIVIGLYLYPGVGRRAGYVLVPDLALVFWKLYLDYNNSAYPYNERGPYILQIIETQAPLISEINIPLVDGGDEGEHRFPYGLIELLNQLGTSSGGLGRVIESEFIRASAVIFVSLAVYLISKELVDNRFQVLAIIGNHRTEGFEAVIHIGIYIGDYVSSIAVIDEDKAILPVLDIN